MVAGDTLWSKQQVNFFEQNSEVSEHDHFICSRKWRKDKCKTQKTENQKEAI